MSETHPFVSYRVYQGYLRTIELILRDCYGTEIDLYQAMRAELRNSRGFKGIQRKGALSEVAVKSLRQAWATEMFVTSQSTVAANAGVLPVACHWGTIQGYYAIFHAAQALTLSSGWWTKPDTSHRGVLGCLSHLVEQRRVLLPPFDSSCVGQKSQYIYGGCLGGFQPSEGTVVSTPSASDLMPRLATLLKTTRDRDIDSRTDDWKRRNRTSKGAVYKRIPASQLASIGMGTHATTLFDFWWRLRVRSNYRDADAFLVGAEHFGTGVVFLESLIAFLQASLFSIESLLGAAVGTKRLREISDSFVSASGTKAHDTVGVRSEFW